VFSRRERREERGERREERGGRFSGSNSVAKVGDDALSGLHVVKGVDHNILLPPELVVIGCLCVWRYLDR
jgi:hypothetical protein